MAVSLTGSADVPQSADRITAGQQRNINKSILGKDDFLKLLVTQLRYQNPLQPMEDKEFISQMATFSSLEQMQNMNTTIGSLADSINNQWLPQMMVREAGQMVGREVGYLNLDEAGELQILAGIVDSVIIQMGIPYLIIDGEAVSLDQITAIGGSVVGMETEYYSKVLTKLDLLLQQLGAETEVPHD